MFSMIHTRGALDDPHMRTFWMAKLAGQIAPAPVFIDCTLDVFNQYTKVSSREACAAIGAAVTVMGLGND